MNWLSKYGPGIALVLGISLVATGLGMLLPLIGGPVFGLLFGILLNNTYGKPQGTHYGVQFSAKKILQWAIIAVGFGLSLTTVWEAGLSSLTVLISSLLAAFVAAYAFGALLKIPSRLKVLIGVGTGICGGSAIAATSPIIEAKEAEIAYAITTIFLFNLVAVLLFPFLGHWLGLSDTGFGLWAGTAINDTSSVVAAGYLFSEQAGDYATIVKLVRTTFIIPIAVALAIIAARQKRREHAQQTDNAGEAGTGGSAKVSVLKVFPWFILWFLCASLFNTIGLFDERLLAVAAHASKFMIVMALTAIGLSANFRKMVKTGFRPILFGLLVWISVAGVSLSVQWMNGQL